MKKSVQVLVFLLFLPMGNVFAETPGTMAQEAQKGYEQGDYSHAIQKWEELRSIGYVNGALYENLGNAAWQMGQGGRARWYFLRGLALSPRSAPLRNNLTFIEEKLGLKPPAPTDGPLSFLQGLPWWKLSLNLFETLKVAGVLSLLFFGMLLVKKWQSKEPSPWIRWGLGVPLFLLVCLMALQVKRLYWRNEAVVLSAGATLLSSPAAEADTGQPLPEGSLVKVLKKPGDFWLVKSPQGNQAWVDASQLGVLSL
jgi:hypothetical protein